MNLLNPSEKKDVDLDRAKIVAVLGGNMYKVQDVNTLESHNVYSVTPRKKGNFVRVSKSTITGVSSVVTKMKIVSI